MGELRNRFKRLAFNGFLTRWDGSGSVAAWRGHLLSASVVFKLVVPQWECMGMCCGHGKDGEVKINQSCYLSHEIIQCATSVK